MFCMYDKYAYVTNMFLSYCKKKSRVTKFFLSSHNILFFVKWKKKWKKSYKCKHYNLQSLRKPYFSEVQFCRHPVIIKLKWFSSEKRFSKNWKDFHEIFFSSKNWKDFHWLSEKPVPLGQTMYFFQSLHSLSRVVIFLRSKN